MERILILDLRMLNIFCMKRLSLRTGCYHVVCFQFIVVAWLRVTAFNKGYFVYGFTFFICLLMHRKLQTLQLPISWIHTGAKQIR